MEQYKKFFKEKILEIGEENITAKNAGVLTRKLMHFAVVFVTITKKSLFLYMIKKYKHYYK
jgi:hypothetical protein